MKYLKKGISFLRSPGVSFENEKETKLTEAFKYMLVLALVTTILGSLVTTMSMGFLTGMIPTYAEGLAAPMIFVISLVLGYLGLTIGSVIWGLWLHLWAYVVGARNGLEQTLKAVVYGQTPPYLLGWIPLVNVFVAIWALVLHGMGIMKYHSITAGRTALAIIIALTIPTIVIGALSLAFISIP